MVNSGYGSNKGYITVVYNFASPRVGNPDFCDIINTTLPVYRIVNTADIIPTLPPSVSPNFLNNEKPYIYKHCGIGKYFTDNWSSLLNNHLMNVYNNSLYKMP